MEPAYLKDPDNRVVRGFQDFENAREYATSMPFVSLSVVVNPLEIASRKEDVLS